MAYSWLVSGDETGLPAAPDDSPWRPGANVRFDHPPRREFPTDRTEPGPSGSDDFEPVEPSRSPPRTRWMLAGSLLALAGIAASVIVFSTPTQDPVGAIEDGANSGRSLPGEATELPAQFDLGGDVTLGAADAPLTPRRLRCLPQRLPSSVDPVWSTEIADARRVLSPVSVADESVVAVAEFDTPAESTGVSVELVVLDIGDGTERWRTALEPSTGAHEVVGIVDGVVIVRSVAGPDVDFRRLFAFDETDGQLLWERGFRGTWSAGMDDTVGAVIVNVTLDFSTVGEVVALDPRTGDVLARLPGEFLGVDGDGRILTRSGDKVLAANMAERADLDERELLGVIEPGSSPYSLLGSSLVVAASDRAAMTVFSPDPASVQDPIEREVPLVGSNDLAAPAFVVGVEALGESTLLITGDRAVHGANVAADSVEIRWRAAGVALSSAPTDRGHSLLIATEGGSRQRVIDSSTGRTIHELQLSPGALQTLGLLPNGVVVQQLTDGESARSALDLDGRQMWTLPGGGPLAVGAGIVVDIEHRSGNGGDGAEGIGISAYGGTVGTAGCSSGGRALPGRSLRSHP